MKWHIFKRYIAHGNDCVVFQARISENDAIIIDIDDCDFTEMFKAIADGSYIIRVSPKNEYDEWLKKPHEPIPIKEIKFLGTKYENIKQYAEMEQKRKKSVVSFMSTIHKNIVYFRFKSPALIDEEGTDPRSETTVVHIVDNIYKIINSNYNNGESILNRKIASMGYEINFTAPDPQCLLFLKRFFTELSKGEINRKNYADTEQHILNGIIGSFLNIHRIKGLEDFEVTLGNNKPLSIPLKNLYNLKNNINKRTVNIIGIPEKPSIRANTFWIKSDEGLFSCYLEDYDDTLNIIKRINIATSEQKSISVEGTIYSSKPGTIKRITDINFNPKL